MEALKGFNMNRKLRIGELEKMTPEKKKWIAEMKDKIRLGEVRRELIEVIPVCVPWGYCSEYAVCDVNHPSECSYEIVPKSEWKKHHHAKEIAEYLRENPDWKVHRLDEVLETLYQEDYDMR